MYEINSLNFFLIEDYSYVAFPFSNPCLWNIYILVEYALIKIEQKYINGGPILICYPINLLAISEDSRYLPVSRIIDIYQYRGFSILAGLGFDIDTRSKLYYFDKKPFQFQ